MKIIGHMGVLNPEAIASLIVEHLKIPQPSAAWRELFQFGEKPKGAWISYTFWITLPDDYTEKPLREAIQKLPGVVMQL
jgi:hypothetical protein